MLSLSVTLAIGLLFAVFSGGACAAETVHPALATFNAAGPARIQTAQWTRTQPVKMQTVGWARWRSNRWYYTQPVRSQPARPQAAQPKAPAPANAQASQPAKPPAASPAQNQPSKPAVAEAAPAARPDATLTPAQQLALHAVEMGVIENTNRQRARYGLRPLRVDLGLVRSARRHTQWMTRNHVLQHTSAGVAENIAMGQSSPTAVLNAWMNSDGHRANILNSGYTRIGVAAYQTPQGTIFWCQQFLR
ncbi:MAG TPA: CAP domain-containing protein [Pirellulales bacterium]|jgi:uncharacterized protein YkwD|nr:CAP domain-containing protein [Pirellulales bacterium]